jgi:hypothetical protein
MFPPSSRPLLPASPSRLLPLLLLALLVVATPALARRCGDDVGGRRVACACGDVVVSSVRLDARHPVTHAPCDGDGLVVESAAGLVVDLGGTTITGSGRGVGLSVTGHGGAELRGPGTIAGFDAGVVARRDALQAVSDVVARGNRTDGFRLAGSGYALLRCQATSNGRQGFVLRGDGFRVEGCQATDNGRDGIEVAGSNASLDAQAGNVARGNRRAAARVRGEGNAVDPALAPPPKARRHHACREGASCR